FLLGWMSYWKIMEGFDIGCEKSEILVVEGTCAEFQHAMNWWISVEVIIDVRLQLADTCSVCYIGAKEQDRYLAKFSEAHSGIAIRNGRNKT
ncbi:MAG: hypothetical protein M3Y56_14605, partial [Armatimonadota bacterium]|nr:hypothetical protein [Armatimonadota bacterium]